MTIFRYLQNIRSQHSGQRITLNFTESCCKGRAANITI